MTRIRTIKSGANSIRQYQGKPSNMETVWLKDDKVIKPFLRPIKPITLRERRARHQKNHPNDSNESKLRGVAFRKKGRRDKELATFFKEHIYTFVDENDLTKKEWVRISGFAGDDE